MVKFKLEVSGLSQGSDLDFLFLKVCKAYGSFNKVFDKVLLAYCTFDY